MKRFRDAHENGANPLPNDSLSASEALSRLRALARGSTGSDNTASNGSGNSSREKELPGTAPLAPLSSRKASPSEPSTPSTPYLLQRLANLNGSSVAGAAAALRESEEKAKSSPLKQRTSFTSQRMRAAAVLPTNVANSDDGRERSRANNEEEEEDSGRVLRSRRLEAPLPLREQGAPRGDPRTRTSSSNAKCSDAAEDRQVEKDVANAVKAPSGRTNNASRPRARLAAKRAPPTERTGAKARPKKSAPAMGPRGKRLVVAPIPIPPPRSHTQQSEALNSPRLSTSSSALFDDLATPLRNKARDVESFLARAARMVDEEDTQRGRLGVGGSTSPPPASFASSFRQPAVAALAASSAAPQQTLSHMRLSDSLPVPPPPRSSAHRYEIFDTVDNAPDTAQPPLSASDGSVALPAPRSSQRRQLARSAVTSTAPPPPLTAVSAMQRTMSGTAGKTPAALATQTGRMVVVDTSTLLNSDPGVLNLLIEKWTLCIPYTAVDELDNISKGKPGAVGGAQQRRNKGLKTSVQHDTGSEWLRHRARELRDWIASALARKDPHVRVQRRSEIADVYDRGARNNDDAILGFAVYLRSKGERHVMFVTEDKYLSVKAMTELGECYKYNDLKRMMGVRNG